jgi:single stranded DNA-binding protein
MKAIKAVTSMNGVNKVIVAGQVTEAGPKLTYSSEGTPQCRLTLVVEEAGKDGHVYKLFLPVEVFSAHGEWAAQHVNAGDTILVDGKLKWKSWMDKKGEKQGRLAVMAWQVSLLGTPASMVSSN